MAVGAPELTPPHAVTHNRASDRTNAELTAFEAIKIQVMALGEDTELLTCPPFFKASIRKHSDHEKLTGKKLFLADKIRIGDIKNESGIKSTLWAYLADNNSTNCLTELVYFSFSRSNKKATRKTADDAHGGLLREEFMHCETPSALTATAKLYLYRKGIKTSFPVEISEHLAREMIRACRGCTDKTLGNPTREQPVYTNEQDAMDTTEDEEEWKLKLEQHREPDLFSQGPPKIQTFDTPASSTIDNCHTTGFQCMESGQQFHANAAASSSSLDVGISTREPIRNTITSHANSNSQAQHPSSVTSNYTYVGSDLVFKLQAARKQELEIAANVQNIQHQLIVARQDIARMHDRYMEIQAEGARLTLAILQAEAELNNLEQNGKDLHVAMTGCKDVQMRIMDNLSPNVRGMIEFGQQVERGPK